MTIASMIPHSFVTWTTLTVLVACGSPSRPATTSASQCGPDVSLDTGFPVSDTADASLAGETDGAASPELTDTGDELGQDGLNCADTDATGADSGCTVGAVTDVASTDASVADTAIDAAGDVSAGAVDAGPSADTSTPDQTSATSALKCLGPATYKASGCDCVNTPGCGPDMSGDSPQVVQAFMGFVIVEGPLPGTLTVVAKLRNDYFDCPCQALGGGVYVVDLGTLTACLVSRDGWYWAKGPVETGAFAKAAPVWLKTSTGEIVDFVSEGLGNASTQVLVPYITPPWLPKSIFATGTCSTAPLVVEGFLRVIKAGKTTLVPLPL